MQKDPRNRLDDAERMKRHPFFAGIDWEKLEVKKVQSPIKISSVQTFLLSRSSLLTVFFQRTLDNFDPKYTHLPITDAKEKKPAAEVENFTFIL